MHIQRGHTTSDLHLLTNRTNADRFMPALRCAARGFEEDWWRMNDPQIPKSIWWLPQIDLVGFRVACELPK